MKRHHRPQWLRAERQSRTLRLMGDPEDLVEWYRPPGAQYQMAKVAAAEARVADVAERMQSAETAVIGRIAITAAADEFLAATSDALAWLAAHPSPDSTVDRALSVAFSAYQDAARGLIEIGVAALTVELGELTGEAVVRARQAMHDAAMAFRNGLQSPSS